MSDIVAAILTKNEAAHIGDCIKSVQWAGRVIVDDSFSDDGTVSIAESLGAQVFQNKFVNFAAARNRVIDTVRAMGVEWILFVDADERVTPELAQEIQQVIQQDEIGGWWIPRYNVMWGHIMQGGGWYPDYQLRLMRVGAAHYDPARQVHEIVVLDGQADYLQEHLIHYNYDSLAQFKFKQDRYIDFEAKILKEKGVRAKPWTYVTMPIREFRRRYIALRGYRDGWVGLQLCSLMSWYMFLSYVRLGKLYWAEQ
jgi:glycosyltransferase involved in cell wall biosynthesis